MARRLILVRHGQVEGGFEGRYVGSTDPGLSAAGLRQAEELTARLAPGRPDLILTSPQRRCIETARAAGGGLAAPIEVERDLREVDFGEWEGLSFAQIAARDAAAVDRWARFEPDFCFPGGESIAEFTGRVAGVVARIAAAPQPTVVAVTHGGVIGFAICALLGLEPSRHGAFHVPRGGAAELALFDGGARLEALGGPGDRP